MTISAFNVPARGPILAAAAILASCAASLCRAQGDPASGLRIEIDERGALGSGYALFARPEEQLRMHIQAAGGAEEWKIEAKPKGPDQTTQFQIETLQTLACEFTGGELSAALDDGIVWKAPQQPGWRKISFVRKTSRKAGPAQAKEDQTQSGETEARIELSVCVLYPFNAEKDEAIEGSPIGVYPNPRSPETPPFVADNPNLYAPPAWFIQVTPQSAELKVSPNFRLGEFSPAEQTGKTHFIALDPRLVMFLEALRLAVQAESPQPRPLKILRAFLSPMDRARLESQGVAYPPFSRYQYGDGAAIIVDGDGDSRMDDLDADGQATSRDAELLADICEETQDRLRIFGGIGVMRNPKDPQFPDTPYVDVDLRGRKTRW